MLWIAIDLPALALESSLQPWAQPEPWVVTDGDCVLIGNSQAHACGVRTGMRLSAACAIAPRLRYKLHDPVAESTALATLAAWALQFTPNVSLESPHALLLDIEGSLGIFGGIRSVIQSIRHGLAEMGYSATLACAPATTAALLLARGGTEIIANYKRAADAAVAALPLRVLDADDATLGTLRAIGMKCLGDLRELPRDGAARRLGRELLDTLDRAFGRAAAPRKFFVPPARFAAQLEFAAEVCNGEALLFAAKRMLTQLGGFLAARHSGIQRFTLSLAHGKDSPATPIEVCFAAPTRDASHMMLVMRERLAAVTLPAAVQALRLEANEILELAGSNSSLFIDRLSAAGEWEKLVERLRARLGPDAVYGLATQAEHRPERAYRHVEPGTPDSAPACSPRPLWLFDTPRSLATTAKVPCDAAGPLALVAGPERIESGWWDHDDFRRDYFIARTTGHSMLWIYRDNERSGDWYLHGIFG